MNRDTCPLCGGKLLPLRVMPHNVPKEKISLDRMRGEFRVTNNVAQISYPHQWYLGHNKVQLLACDICGHVQVIKEEDE